MPERQPGDGPGAPRVGSSAEPDTDQLDVGPPPVEPPTQPPTQPAIEPDTRAVPPDRWTGAAAVPAPQPRRRRRLNRTLDLPLDERAGPEPEPADEPHDPDNPPPPVDPWADAAPAWEPASGWPHVAPALPPAHQPPGLPSAAQPPTLPPTRVAPPVVSPFAPHAGAPRPALPTQPTQPAQPAQPAPSPRKRSERRRPPGHVPPAGGPPPGWTVPPGYELRRRRRRWPRRLTWFMLTIGLCCGCPAYFVVPMWQQYPATAAVPAEVSGYTRLQKGKAARTERELQRRAREGHLFAEGTFAAVYSGGDGWQVTLYGTTGFRLAPKSDLETEFSRLTEDLKITKAREVEPGDMGGHQRCGFGTGADGGDLVVCGWADHGSLGVATFSAGSLDEDAETFRELRALIITRG